VSRPWLFCHGLLRLQLDARPVIALVLGAVYLLMLVELQVAVFNDRALRARGAVEPPDDVFWLMRIAYPGAFLLIGLEALRHAWLYRDVVLVGLLLFGWAKALKFWVIQTLGSRWSFRVLVVPGLPLVTSGPYRWMRHPNYVAVLGEIVAIAIALSAPIGGAIAFAGFGWLLRKRIAVEERALGMRRR
jgi:methyltransferase